ncbi:NAD-dependent epimerase/dehydratase family protein [Noviherbaspirillum saxi]|uniref:NAD-dependent epimerase/dehydratase family protein n=1 Tax=Noviherbaspirillum saxi TaxID=2320863 RepID=A0A3A3FJK9_9BURK|nr:NAD-dependent epimerase/dehydratase family protein [Noviherbaspirillum saxi]RJF95683.1 NAD-dependent epimerase/dehydratase family protein [Noviherbaspirillum saxi]
MHIVITGAGGFVGSALGKRLLSVGMLADTPISRLTLIDRNFSSQADDSRVRLLSGDFGQQGLLDAMSETPVDVVFHLASVPGAQAERDFRLGYEVNLIGTLALFEHIAKQRGDCAPRVVFASSIAVYGSALPAVIDRDTRAHPALSYGAHKLVGEIVLADLSRRGMVDGLSLRLPGIVARPGASAGHGSAFMSDIMHAAAAGSPYSCPVSADATSWWMSLPCCVDNLLHAAQIDTSSLSADRAYALPVLWLTLRQVIDALGRRFGNGNIVSIEHVPNEAIENLFGCQPPLRLPEVEALGFRHDGDADRLVLRALQETG